MPFCHEILVLVMKTPLTGNVVGFSSYSIFVNRRGVPRLVGRSSGQV